MHTHTYSTHAAYSGWLQPHHTIFMCIRYIAKCIRNITATSSAGKWKKNIDLFRLLTSPCMLALTNTANESGHGMLVY